jgi:hypothetical protein
MSVPQFSGLACAAHCAPTGAQRVQFTEMERTGIEPVTYALQRHRSPN